MTPKERQERLEERKFLERRVAEEFESLYQQWKTWDLEMCINQINGRFFKLPADEQIFHRRRILNEIKIRFPQMVQNYRREKGSPETYASAAYEDITVEYLASIGIRDNRAFDLSEDEQEFLERVHQWMDEHGVR